MSISVRCEAASAPFGWVYNGITGGMPIDAIAAGRNGYATLYLCRAYYGNTIQPGYADAHGSVCNFSYGGAALSSTEFDWYVPVWESSTGQPVPANAIPLGAEPAGSGAVYRYICRVGQTPGKYGQDLGGCLYPYGGAEIHQTNGGFAWLVDPNNNVRPPSAASFTQPLSSGAPYYEASVGPYEILSSSAEYLPPLNGAIVSGPDSDGTTLYLCAAYFGDGMQPGKARQDWSSCDVSWGGGEHYVSPFAYLVANYTYIPQGRSDPTCASNDSPCTSRINLIPAGVDSDGSTLYSCTAAEPDALAIVPGKTKLAWGLACSFPWEGVETYGSPSSVLIDGYQ